MIVKNYEQLGLICGEICLLLCCRFLFCQGSNIGFAEIRVMLNVYLLTCFVCALNKLFILGKRRGGTASEQKPFSLYLTYCSDS